MKNFYKPSLKTSGFYIQMKKEISMVFHPLPFLKAKAIAFSIHIILDHCPNYFLYLSIINFYFLKKIKP